MLHPTLDTYEKMGSGLVTHYVGQVVTWQLTNSTSLNEVEKILSHLKERVEGSQLILFVDNCCHSRLQKVFGMHTLVKLDLFAVRNACNV